MLPSISVSASAPEGDGLAWGKQRIRFASSHYTENYAITQ
jgi:hypothetical protein